MSPALILDLIILAILVVFIALGAYRGLVLTLCGLLAVFVAFFGASFLSSALCEPVAGALEPVLQDRIQAALTQSVQRSSSGSLAGDVPLVEDLPLREALDALKGTPLYKNLAASFRSAVDRGVESATGNAAQSLAKYAARELARAVLFLAGFLLILLVWFLISHALDLVAKLPVLSTANRVGGAAIGAVKGFLFLCVAAWVLHTVTKILPATAAEGSLLLPYLLHPADLLDRLQALVP